MKHLKILVESAIMALGFGLVLITLSGTTQTWAIWISVTSVSFYIASQYLGEDK